MVVDHLELKSDEGDLWKDHKKTISDFMQKYAHRVQAVMSWWLREGHLQVIWSGGQACGHDDCGCIIG
jgi:hypothetical protein